MKSAFWAKKKKFDFRASGHFDPQEKDLSHSARALDNENKTITKALGMDRH